MKYFKFLFVFISAILFQVEVHSQQTGFWEKQVSFNGGTRTFSYYVPTSYSPSKKYKLLINLHGQGDGGTRYCQQLTPFSTSGFIGDIILVCPSEGTNLSGFADPPGEDDGIIDAVVSETKSMYNIDVDEIILSGFSLGGRAALKIGLDDYQNYKGLILLRYKTEHPPSTNPSKREINH